LIAYVDSSVLLRFVLGQRGALKEWTSIEYAVASALVQVECLRTLDRLKLEQRIADDEISERRATVFELLKSVELFDITGLVLERASQPLATVLGTLDAIHLATALLWREANENDLTMATHDTALATASRATGFAVIGVG